MSDINPNEKTANPAGLEQPGPEHYSNPTAWWDDRPLPLKILIGTGGSILVVAALIMFGFVTMWLWNWLMPDIFGLKAIDYWQAWGLILLSTIFFKRIGSGGSAGGNGRSTERKRKRELRKYLHEGAPK